MSNLNNNINNNQNLFQNYEECVQRDEKLNDILELNKFQETFLQLIEGKEKLKFNKNEKQNKIKKENIKKEKKIEDVSDIFRIILKEKFLENKNKEELKNLMRPILILKIERYQKNLIKRMEELKKAFKDFDMDKNKDEAFFLSRLMNLIGLEKEINKEFGIAEEIFKKQKYTNENSAKDAKKAMKESKKLINVSEKKITKLCDEMQRIIEEIEKKLV